MILLELAAQGIRGVTPAGGRVTLRPGYNVLPADGAALHRLVEAVLWPDAVAAETVPRSAAGPGTASARVGVTLLGNDNVTYRLVRDLAGGCQLHRFDPERRSFALVSQDLPAIGRHLVSPGGAPSRSRFNTLLSVSAADLPSKQPVAGLRPAAAGVPPARRPLGAEERIRKIAELKAELQKAKGAEKHQYRLDGLQSKLFKLEETLKSGAKIHEGLETSEAALRELLPVAVAAEQLGDSEARVGAFEKAKEKLEEGLSRLESERSALGEESAPAPAPFWRDSRFLAAGGAGLAFALLAAVAVGAGETSFRYLALLDIPAFAYAGYVAWRWVDALEERERSGRRRKRFQEWELKVQEQYERDTGQVRGAMATLGLSSLGDLKDALGRLADAQSVVAEWRRRLAEWEAKPETRDAAAEKERVDGEIKQAEADLASQVGGYARDPRSIEMEIAALEAEAGAPAPAAVPSAPTTPLAPAGDPLMALLERAATELQATAAATVGIVSQRVGQLLPALSAQRLAGCLVDERGNVLVQGGGRTVPAGSLPPADRDLCFLALKIGLIEHALSSGKTIALIDDAFSGLPEGARRTVARLLKQLARAGQILHVTSDPAFREAADHAA